MLAEPSLGPFVGFCPIARPVLKSDRASFRAVIGLNVLWGTPTNNVFVVDWVSSTTILHRGSSRSQGKIGPTHRNEKEEHTLQVTIDSSASVPAVEDPGSYGKRQEVGRPCKPQN